MIHGSCLCRAVRFEVAGTLGMAAMCHCESCRKASGTAFATNAPARCADVSFVAGEDLLASYESSPGKHRVFCSRCGSPVFSRRDDEPDTLRLRLGTLDDDPGVRPSVHGWTSDKAAWERLPHDGLPRFATGAADSREPRAKIRAEAPGSSDAKTLIAALDAYLADNYPPDAIFGLHDDDHDPDRMVFLIARIDDRPVACGAIRSLDADAAEVKRMFVVPELRGSGLARRLLGDLETIAMGRRHSVLRLETGNRSVPALALYRSSGYREIPLYGEYVGCEYSICFEKRL